MGVVPGAHLFLGFTPAGPLTFARVAAVPTLFLVAFPFGAGSLGLLANRIRISVRRQPAFLALFPPLVSFHCRRFSSLRVLHRLLELDRLLRFTRVVPRFPHLPGTYCNIFGPALQVAGGFSAHIGEALG
ncbi:hypothetical protein FB45DRAFT_1028206 [Roridomyces roridus]|uniref:Uncharacterized protein n=1 Tax=Roridomyces roridus TaxID=1738132 RepID=A0AAD7BUK9_9AGAR|nr:hypothetical protein FB45DRAFT_1028206 [Roridomyces roridus]